MQAVYGCSFVVGWESYGAAHAWRWWLPEGHHSVIPMHTFSLLHISGIYGSHWCSRYKSNSVLEVGISLKSSRSICVIFLSQEVQTLVKGGKMMGYLLGHVLYKIDCSCCFCLPVKGKRRKHRFSSF